MKLDCLITKDEFEELRKKSVKTTIGIGYYVLDDDLKFVVERIDNKDWYRLESSYKSRVADSETNHANIHRPEQRKYKRYYEGKS